VYTDTPNKQLGAVIMQEGKPLAFYSRKLNSAQTRYTTGEQELLSIVETLKEFRDILLGQQVVVHTVHLNILYGKLSNDRITRWRLLLEEYGPKYVHIAGKNIIVADTLSRLGKDEDEKLSQTEEDLVLEVTLRSWHQARRSDVGSSEAGEPCFMWRAAHIKPTGQDARRDA
jgi:hypothetical protein